MAIEATMTRPERRTIKAFRAQLRGFLSLSKSPPEPKRAIVIVGHPAGTASVSEKTPTITATKASVSTTISQVQKALVVVRKGEYELRDNFPTPNIMNDDEVMIQNCAVALNPIDWKSVDYNFCLPAFPWITGRESSGVVVKIGENVSNLKVGDRVWTSTYYRDIRAGCFQEYIVVPQHTVLPIPSNLSFEEAASLGVAALTAAMTLWKWLDVQMPSRKPSVLEKPLTSDSGYWSTKSVSEDEKENEWILIWGGSTVTGQFATQLASLSSLKVITVCSAKTAALSKMVGAAHVVTRDERSMASICHEIEAITKGGISRAIDLVGGATAAQCLAVCSTDMQRKTRGEARVVFSPLAMMDKNQVVPDSVRVETVEMKQFVLNKDSKLYAERLNDLIANCSIRLPELQIIAGGLPQVQAGLELLKKGDLGGRKLIISFTK
jgi:NADPH:quinone reductase-like Zn-dependent oxidoreductase